MAFLDQFFRESDPERDRSISDASNRRVPVHIACSFHAPGNINSLSEVCADAAGRLYRYDSKAKVLVLIFCPDGARP
jgi:hypothetical protein